MRLAKITPLMPVSNACESAHEHVHSSNPTGWITGMCYNYHYVCMYVCSYELLTADCCLTADSVSVWYTILSYMTMIIGSRVVVLDHGSHVKLAGRTGCLHWRITIQPTTSTWKGSLSLSLSLDRCCVRQRWILEESPSSMPLAGSRPPIIIIGIHNSERFGPV